MTDYISREAAEKAAMDYIRRIHPDSPAREIMALDIYGIMHTIPTADVVERKHGQWIWDDEGYHCSECFYHAYGETGEVLSGHWNFCPNCGAALEGDS